MEKTIESDIRISNVIDRVIDPVVINEVPVVGDVQVQGSEATVVNGIVDPDAIVVNVENV